MERSRLALVLGARICAILEEHADDLEVSASRRAGQGRFLAGEARRVRDLSVLVNQVPDDSAQVGDRSIMQGRSSRR